MSKYGELPDIDHESKEVFETSDVENDNENHEFLNLEKRDSIDETVYSTIDARLRFENEIVDSNITDFSDRIDTKSSFQTSRVDETIDQKLTRIKRELEEIQILQQKDEQKLPQTKEINFLSELLDKLNIDAVTSLSHISSIDEGKVKIQSASASSKADIELKPLSDDLIALELESRINRLETHIGLDASQASSTQTIQGILNDMSRKVNIIYNPEYSLEKVKNIIEELNTSTESAITTRKTSRLNSSAEQDQLSGLKTIEDDRINELYDKMGYFDSISSVVPSILNRLKSLNALHSEISLAVQFTNNIDTIMSEVNIDIEKWDESLNDINGKLDDSIVQLESNKKEVNEWISDLQKKIDT